MKVIAVITEPAPALSPARVVARDYRDAATARPRDPQGARDMRRGLSRSTPRYRSFLITSPVTQGGAVLIATSRGDNPQWVPRHLDRHRPEPAPGREINSGSRGKPRPALRLLCVRPWCFPTLSGRHRRECDGAGTARRGELLQGDRCGRKGAPHPFAGSFRRHCSGDRRKACPRINSINFFTRSS